MAETARRPESAIPSPRIELTVVEESGATTARSHVAHTGHVRIGSPNVRALPLSEACAATESPNGPAPTTAVSMRSTSLNLAC